MFKAGPRIVDEVVLLLRVRLDIKGLIGVPKP